MEGKSTSDAGLSSDVATSGCLDIPPASRVDEASGVSAKKHMNPKKKFLVEYLEDVAESQAGVGSQATADIKAPVAAGRLLFSFLLVFDCYC